MTNRANLLALSLILLLAAIPRVWAAVYDQGIFWPDEIFQTLEPAHRFAFGYGFVSWEFQDGARSWLFPGFIGIVWKLAAWLGFDSAPALVILAKVVMVVLSLAGIYASMRLAEELAGSLAAPFAGALTAAFPASLVYAGRAMTEMVSAPLVLAATLLTIRPGSSRPWTAGALAALAIYVRYQNGLFALGLLIVLLAGRRGSDALRYAGGLAVLGVAGGLLDWITWGKPFHSFWTYVQFNLIEGKSSWYGTAPFDYYLSVAWTSTGLALVVILAGFLISWACARGLWLLVVVYVIAHSLVPHKEFRFLMPIVPLFLALAGAGLAFATTKVASWRASSIWTPWLAWIIALILGAAMGRHAAAVSLGDMGAYSGSPLANRSPWHLREDINLLLWKAGERKDLCGLGLVGWAPVWTGGYTYLHRDVPILMIPVQVDVPRESFARVNYLVSELPVPQPDGYFRVTASKDLGLFRRDGSCSPPPENYRLLPQG